MENTAKITKSMRKEDVTRDWWVIDAADQTLGRVASQVARLIRGKHKPWFTPHVDTGDFVIIINAGKIQLQGKRAGKKEYFHYTGYPGGGRFRSFTEIMKTKPEFVIHHAVKGMLPKNRLGKTMISKLKVYPGIEHPHVAQMPKEYSLPY